MIQKQDMKKKNKKRFRMISLMLVLAMILSFAGCGKDDKGQTSEAKSTEAKKAEDPGYKYLKYKDMTADEIVAGLTLDQKAAQMVMAQLASIDASQMKDHCYGAVMSRIDPVDDNYEDWQKIVEEYQRAAIESDAGIPIIYGNDDVHGVSFAVDTVLFPHNIGLGAANDKELMYEIGQITGDEAMLCHMIWNYAPCVAQSEDPRWGRTYESYGSDLDIIKTLSTEYTKGLKDAGMIACPKHFFGDGNVEYGSGEKTMLNMLMDRGDAKLSNDEIDKLLSVYQAQIDAGAQSIMVSHSSVNGVKMHENGKYIQYLKNEMGFKGFISGDWNSVQNTSGSTYYDQVVNSVNAGVDMLMEVDDYETVRQYIVEAVGKGDIPKERVDDAARRIIQVKLDAGVFKDPFFEKLKTRQTKTGSAEYRAVAEKAVEESLVLLKNDNDILPFKSGTKVYITGPAANSAQIQCGGWSLGWISSPENNIAGATTILEGFEKKASEYGIELITDKSKAAEADVVLLVVGEQPYVEWYGDTEDMELCGSLGLAGNAKAISEAKELGKPIVTCIVAGRQVIMNNYYGDWDSVVMCYLPGTEGQGIADVLCGGTDFKGKLPSPWYSSTDQIGTGTSWLERGYGLSYN